MVKLPIEDTRIRIAVSQVHLYWNLTMPIPQSVINSRDERRNDLLLKGHLRAKNASLVAAEIFKFFLILWPLRLFGERIACFIHE